MTEKILFDSHKLIYHPKRISEWLEGKNIYPIYAEISPTQACNCRCTFCVFNYLNHKPVFIDTTILLKRVKEMAKLGLKSINYSGEGEPLLHKNIIRIITETKKTGIDVSLSTNGILFDKKTAETTLSNLSWIRFSINAGTKDTYTKVHRVNSYTFNKIIDNLSSAVEIKKKYNYPVTIGVQLILLPENLSSVLALAKLTKKTGADYFVVKPLIPHPKNKGQINPLISFVTIESLKNKLGSLNKGQFSCTLRLKTFKKLKEKRTYKKCLALPFFVQISSCADVYTCIPYVGNENFKYGNLYKNTFQEIWLSKKRKMINGMIKKLDVNKCMPCCRPDETNRFLWQLKNPPLHVNFI